MISASAFYKGKIANFHVPEGGKISNCNSPNLNSDIVRCMLKSIFYKKGARKSQLHDEICRKLTHVKTKTKQYVQIMSQSQSLKTTFP